MVAGHRGLADLAVRPTQPPFWRIHVNRYALAAALGAVPLGACQPAGAPRQMTAAHGAAIRDSVQATLDAFRRYSAAGQWDSLAALYDESPEFRWVEQGVVQYRSAGQIRQALRRVSPGTRIETTHHDTQIAALAPGAASVATAFHTRFVDPRSPAGMEFGGVITMVLAHRAGGWRIVVGHTSAPGR
jgi:hypothetical protein